MLEAPISSVPDSRLLTCLEALADVPLHDKPSKANILRQSVAIEVRLRLLLKTTDPALERRAETLADIPS
jgi:hypothetical protein